MTPAHIDISRPFRKKVKHIFFYYKRIFLLQNSLHVSANEITIRHKCHNNIQNGITTSNTERGLSVTPRYVLTNSKTISKSHNSIYTDRITNSVDIRWCLWLHSLLFKMYAPALSAVSMVTGASNWCRGSIPPLPLHIYGIQKATPHLQVFLRSQRRSYEKKKNKRHFHRFDSPEVL
jgi:hypothetical protein